MKKLFLFIATLLAANSVHAQWAPDVRLTNDPFSSNISVSNSHCIAASNDTLHVVWYDNRDGNFEIYYKRSTDGGATWESDTRMTTNSFLSYDPCIVLSGPVLHLFWGDSRDGNREIYYKRSLNGGNNWGADIRLTNAIRASESPSAAISDSVIHLTWYDERDDPSGNWYTEIYYKRSTDLGLTWGPDFRLTEKSAYAGFPCIAVAGQTVHIVWEDMRNGDYDVYYKRSTDGGLSWGLDTLLTNSLADQSDPCITVSDSVVYVVWHDSRDGNQEIYYKRSADGGITWGVDTRLTNNSGYSEYPTLAVSGSNVHVVWDDNRDANFEIYYKRSLDGGLTWGADTRLTNAVNNSQSAFIALSDSIVNVIWNDKRDGNWEIYYKRNPSGNPITGLENNLITYTNQQISIWPNPASNIIHLNFTNYSNEKTFLAIRNILGEELLSKQIQSDESVFDVSCLQNGLYFVELTTVDKHMVSKKLIILK